MARRLLQIDEHKPVQPVAMPALPDDNAPLNTFPPEAAPAVARQLRVTRPDAEVRMHITPPPAEHVGAARAALERARLQAEELARAQVTGATDRSDLSRLFQPAAPKPTVDVRSALAYLASRPAATVDLHSVASDMSGRGRFTSARQFEYAKAICNKPRNRRLLRNEYDLLALDREEFSGGAPQQPTWTYAPGVRVGFECVIAGTPVHSVMITFSYSVDGRISVRTIAVPSNRITISGRLGDRVRCSVDAEWLLTERRVNPSQIPTANLHSGGAAGATVPSPVRRRVRHMRQ